MGRTPLLFALICGLVPAAAPVSTATSQTAVSCNDLAGLQRVLQATTDYGETPLCPYVARRAFPDGHIAQAAAYLPDTGEIQIAPDLDLSTPAGRGYLLHELVHAYQYASGAADRMRCPALLELEAYGVQAAYLREHGDGEGAALVTVFSQLLGHCR